MSLEYPILRKLFTSLASRDALSSGYIFFGRPGKERRIFAESLAHLLEGKEFSPCSSILKDALIVEADSGSIGIEAIRRIKLFLLQKSIFSPRRTVIIDRADCLTSQAENALLKISEEPPEGSLLIILVDNPEALFQTLQSRFQKIYFPFRSREDMEKMAIQSQYYKTAREIIAAPYKERKKNIKSFLDSEQDPLPLIDCIIIDLFIDSPSQLRFIQQALRVRHNMSSLNLNPRLQLESILI